MADRTKSVLKYASKEDCPKIENHTASPDHYLAHHAWAEKMRVTHEQHRCPDCGFWVIWKRKSADAKGRDE